MTPFARAPMNAGIVRVSEAKMAKSAGNLVLAGELLAGPPAAVIRLLNAHTRVAGSSKSACRTSAPRSFSGPAFRGSRTVTVTWPAGR